MNDSTLIGDSKGTQLSQRCVSVCRTCQLTM